MDAASRTDFQAAQVLPGLRDTTVSPNQEWLVPKQPVSATNSSWGPGDEETVGSQRGGGSWLQELSPEGEVPEACPDHMTEAEVQGELQSPGAEKGAPGG